MYGARVGKQVFSCTSLGSTLLNFLLAVFAVCVIQVTHRQPYGYGPGFYACAGLSFAGAVAACKVRIRHQWHHPQFTETLTK